MGVPRLAERLQSLGPEAPPLTMLYGEFDWMDPNAGVELAGQLRGGADVFLVEGAGHQMFVENPLNFNAAALRALAATGPYALTGVYRGLSRAGLGSAL